MAHARPALLLTIFGLACARDKAPDDPAAPDDSATETPLPYGDNLTLLGEAASAGAMPPEATGVVAREEGWTFLCGGTTQLQVYDTRLPSAPALEASISFPSPAGPFRCQHLALVGEDRLVATHHGDETSPPWIGLADIGDPTAPEGLDAWSDGVSALESVVVDGTTAFVAAHEAGVLVFDLSADALSTPESLPGVTGNANSLALRGTTLAVGDTEGGLQLLDTVGAELGALTLSGPIHDLAWLDDETLVAACGASGLDRVEVASASVTHHVETGSSALDLAVLADGSLAVAAWDEVQVYDPDDLTLLGVENPAGAGQDAMVLALDALGDTLYLGEWRALMTYAWDPAVAAPDLALDVASVDLGLLASGEADSAALVLQNLGPQDLEITAISSSDAAVSVDRSALTIPAGSADFVELSWTSTGAELNATITITSDDPDEGSLALAVRANRPGVGVGDPLPAFTYLAFNGTETYDSSDLGGPVLLSYFATF